MWILRALRDPSWQSVGVLVAVLSLFFAFGSGTARSELALVPYQSIQFSEYQLPSDRVKMLIKGLPSDLQSVQATYVFISNDGDKPLRATDFAAPITVSKGPGTKRIFFVSSCADQAAQQPVAARRTYAPLDWVEFADRWQATPLLLNPKENACAIVVSEVDPSASKESAKDRFGWDARIIGWKFNVYSSFEEYADSVERRPVDYFWTMVVLEGTGVYWFVLLQGVFFLVVAYMAAQAGWTSPLPASSLFRLWIVATLSITSAEILVSVFVTKLSQAPIVWPLLAAHVGLCGYLLYRIVRRVRLGLGRSIDAPSDREQIAVVVPRGSEKD